MIENLKKTHAGHRHKDQPFVENCTQSNTLPPAGAHHHARGEQEADGVPAADGAASEQQAGDVEVVVVVGGEGEGGSCQASPF